MQITSRYGTEANKAAVDFNVYGPTGNSVHKEDAVSETEIAGKGQRGGPWHRMSCPTLPPACDWTADIMLLATTFAVTAEGGQGPWRACFRVSKGQVGRTLVPPHLHQHGLVPCVHPTRVGIACCCLQILRPSVIVKISYFTVNSMSMVGTNFEWQRNSAAGGETPEAVDPKHLGEDRSHPASLWDKMMNSLPDLHCKGNRAGPPSPPAAQAVSLPQAPLSRWRR